MLEQRRAQEKGYVTLKETAELANYTPDYIGQLFRAGKIHGEQVYSSVAGVTTEAEVRSYLKDKERIASVVQSGIDFLSHQILKGILYVIIAAIAVLLLLLQYILYVSIDTRLDEFVLAISS